MYNKEEKPNTGKTVRLNGRYRANLPYRNGKTEAMDRFVARIKNFELLTPDEEKKIFDIIHQGTPEQKEILKDKIIKSHQRFVYALAKCYTHDEDLIMDLVSEGNIGLLTAIDSYEPSRDVKFLTYAVHYIRRGIVDFIINKCQLVQKPNIIRTYHLLPKIKNDFLINTQRMPTEDEIAAIMEEEYGVKITDMSDLYELKFDSIDVTPDSDSSKKNSPEDGFGLKAVSYNDAEVTFSEESQKAMASALLSTLKERDRNIVEMYFGIGYPMEFSTDAISKATGLTTERVRQIVECSQKKMRAAAVSHQMAH